jgi:hypothetical protein
MKRIVILLVVVVMALAGCAGVTAKPGVVDEAGGFFKTAARKGFWEGDERGGSYCYSVYHYTGGGSNLVIIDSTHLAYLMYLPSGSTFPDASVVPRQTLLIYDLDSKILLRSASPLWWYEASKKPVIEIGYKLSDRDNYCESRGTNTIWPAFATVGVHVDEASLSATLAADCPDGKQSAYCNDLRDKIRRGQKNLLWKDGGFTSGDKNILVPDQLNRVWTEGDSQLRTVLNHSKAPYGSGFQIYQIMPSGGKDDSATNFDKAMRGIVAKPQGGADKWLTPAATKHDMVDRFFNMEPLAQRLVRLGRDFEEAYHGASAGLKIRYPGHPTTLQQDQMNAGRIDTAFKKAIEDGLRNEQIGKPKGLSDSERYVNSPLNIRTFKRLEAAEYKLNVEWYRASQAAGGAEKTTIADIVKLVSRSTQKVDTTADPVAETEIPEAAK